MGLWIILIVLWIRLIVLWIILMVLCGRCAVAISFSTSLLDLYISGASRWWCCRCCDCLIIISRSSSDSLLRSGLARSRKSTSLTDQALLVHSSAKNFLTIRHVFSITTFFVTVYRAGRSCGCYYFCILQHQQNCYIGSNSAVLVGKTACSQMSALTKPTFNAPLLIHQDTLFNFVC